MSNNSCGVSENVVFAVNVSLLNRAYLPRIWCLLVLVIQKIVWFFQVLCPCIFICQQLVLCAVGFGRLLSITDCVATVQLIHCPGSVCFAPVHTLQHEFEVKVVCFWGDQHSKCIQIRAHHSIAFIKTLIQKQFPGSIIVLFIVCLCI